MTTAKHTEHTEQRGQAYVGGWEGGWVWGRGEAGWGLLEDQYVGCYKLFFDVAEQRNASLFSDQQDRHSFYCPFRCRNGISLPIGSICQKNKQKKTITKNKELKCQRRISDTEGLQLLSKASCVRGCCNKDTLVSCMAKNVKPVGLFPVV